MPTRSIGLVLLVVLCAPVAHAQSTPLLYPLFQDHAVLQRDRPISVWGQAKAAELVSVSLGDSSAQARADASGRWSAVLPAMSGGGPYVLTAQGSSGTRESAGDVLVGDVFLCSGQSNMELDVLRAGDSRNEISNSANDSIRLLNIEHAVSPVALQALQNPVAWQIAAPETVPNWSAACFFFARELQKSIHVPIGLMQSAWGGANIRPWISAGELHDIGGFDAALGILRVYAKDPSAAQVQFAAQWEQWWRSKSGQRAGTEPWNPSASGEWQRAPLPLNDWRFWGVPELRDFKGLVWYRTTITLSAAQAKSAATLALGPINQIDETWINGRALGNTFGYGAERSYSIAQGSLHAGDNVLVVNVLSDYGGGGLLAGGAKRALQLAGGDSIPLDGPWQYRIAPAAVGYPPRAPWEAVGGLSTLYNAMIAPLGSYGLRAVLWYQGESNTGDPRSYEALLAALMADWRRQFGAELPFLIVQLPNYGPQAFAPVESGWAGVREAQRLAVAHDPHAGLAVTIDIGEPRNLHPTNKQDVGSRLARAARHVVYGEALAPSGPVPLAAAPAAPAAPATGKIVVGFSDVEGQLVAYSHDRPIGFELCADAPGSCRFADARIDGSQVLLSIPDAMSPTRVRYCWGDSPVCTLFDLAALPAGPFELRIGH
jgi:sialate O-acetylesterase